MKTGRPYPTANHALKELYMVMYRCRNTLKECVQRLDHVPMHLSKSVHLTFQRTRDPKQIVLIGTVAAFTSALQMYQEPNLMEGKKYHPLLSNQRLLLGGDRSIGSR